MTLSEWRQDNKEKDFTTAPEKFEQDSVFIEVKTPTILIHFDSRDKGIMQEYHGLIKEIVGQYLVSEKSKVEINKIMTDFVLKKNEKLLEGKERFPGME